MSAIDIVRIISLVTWLSVAILRVSSVYRVLRGKARYYDVLAAIISGVGFLIVGFNLRWFLPPSLELHLGLYCFSIMLALCLIRVLWQYESAAK